MVGKLCSSKRQQNALTSAIKEYGALRRTVYAARYLADETYRRRIARQLNKGYGQDKHETHSGPASPCVEALARPRRGERLGMPR